MKRWNKLLFSSLIAAVLMAQPVCAEESVALVGPGMEASAVVQSGGSPVIVAGGSSQEMQSGGPGMVGAGAVSEPAQQAAGDVQQMAETAQEAEAADLIPVEQEQSQPAGRVVDPSRPMVALTYDDGPQPSVGNRIMDCLAQYGGKATFFLVGDRVPGFAAEVQRMAAEGHEVANHSQSHVYLQKADAGTIQAQVAQGNAAIQAASGAAPTLMRLPGGNHNATVRANVNMPMIQWSIDTLDWKTRNADATVNAVLSKVQDGDIILMHELYSQTADATDRLVPELVNRGFQLVTVSEMAAAKGIVLQPGQIYSSMR